MSLHPTEEASNLPTPT